MGAGFVVECVGNGDSVLVRDGVIGVGGGVEFVRVAVVVEVQPTAALRATSAPVRTYPARFTTPL